MRNYPKNFGDSGPEYILDLDGPDGNVYVLWGVIKNLLGEECIEESKNNGHICNPETPSDTNGYYSGYKGVLDYMIHMLPQIEFRMYGDVVQQVSDYEHGLRHDKRSRQVAREFTPESHGV
jgi:hypothetical protein